MNGMAEWLDHQRVVRQQACREQHAGALRELDKQIQKRLRRRDSKPLLELREVVHAKLKKLDETLLPLRWQEISMIERLAGACGIK
jgi:hypothetical protein